MVDPRIASIEGVGARRLDRPGRIALARLERTPVRHLRAAFDLGVDRPARAVVVRAALAGACLHVGEDAEFEVRVFVENLSFRRCCPDRSTSRRTRRRCRPGCSTPRMVSRAAFVSCSRSAVRQSPANCSRVYPMATLLLQWHWMFSTIMPSSGGSPAWIDQARRMAVRCRRPRGSASRACVPVPSGILRARRRPG